MKRILSSLILVSFSAMVASAQQTPESLGQLWVEAIREHSIEKIKPLIHPNCPKGSVENNILERMVSDELPLQFVFETRELGPKSQLEKAYIVIPDKQLNINYITKTKDERMKFGIGKGFPIAKLNDRWFFTICTKL